MTEGCRALEAVVRERRATRQFLPTPLTSEQIRAVLADAQNAPSNCNTQPWHVHVASGAMKDTLSAARRSGLAQMTGMDVYGQSIRDSVSLGNLDL